MTDQEPIRPATDEQLAAWKELGAMGRIFIPADVVDRLAARIEADAEEVKRLRVGYAAAIEDIDSWAMYASQYFQQKHRLEAALAAHRARLKGESHDR